MRRHWWWLGHAVVDGIVYGWVLSQVAYTLGPRILTHVRALLAR